MDSSKPKRTVSRKRSEEPAVAATPVEQSKPARGKKSGAKVCAPVTPTESVVAEVITPAAVVASVSAVVAPVVEAPVVVAAALAPVAAVPAPATPVLDTTPAAVIAPVLTPDEVAELAYHFWVNRGCPMGSPDSDWLRAEQELRRKKRSLVNA
jgi:hypothetical protein